jgi:hypothetical protein
LNEEGILYADLDLEEVIKGKYEFDVSGHYNRPDVFTFNVNTGSITHLDPAVPLGTDAIEGSGALKGSGTP